MKKYLLALCILVSATLSAQWNNLPLNSGYDLLNCSFPSNDTGYISSGKIYRTFNGGLSFDSVIIPNAVQIHSIDFRTNLDGVIAVDLSASGNSIFRTLNGGTTWQNISPPPFSGQGMNVKFADALHGTYLTSAPVIYNTANGGITWDTMTFGYDYFKTIDFPTANTGYIGGFDGTFNYRGEIAKTTDGGVTWNIVTSFTQNYSLIDHIQFVSADTGFACFSPYMQSARLIRTYNGAATWDTVLFAHGIIVKFAFSDYQNGFIVNDSGSIYRTSNAGVTWTLDRLQTNTLTDINVTPSFAYAIGNDGLVIKRNLQSNIPDPHYNTEIKLYPNPGVDRVNLFLPHAVAVETISAIDVSGRNCGNLLFSALSANELSIDTRSLAKGYYVLEIKGKDETFNVKFEKSR
jgi:photosystem II stability/assembly factor-like uncharacterized protein